MSEQPAPESEDETELTPAELREHGLNVMDEVLTRLYGDQNEATSPAALAAWSSLELLAALTFEELDRQADPDVDQGKT